jgi:nucleotide-binding universal stress UspA family protein
LNHLGAPLILSRSSETYAIEVALVNAEGLYLNVAKQETSGRYMLLFERILVPLDGSEHSMHALEKAVQIAKKFDGKITLVHVYSVLSSGVVPMAMYEPVYEPVTLPPDLVTKLAEAVRKAGVTILEKAEKKVKAEGVQSKTLLREGHVVEEILKAAKEENVDLIVIGARGLSTIKEIFLGSVSHGVTLHAPCPVLLMK